MIVQWFNYFVDEYTEQLTIRQQKDRYYPQEAYISYLKTNTVKTQDTPQSVLAKRGNTKSKDTYKQELAKARYPADAPARVGNSIADNKTEGAAECGRCSVIGSTEGNQLCDDC